MLSKDTSNCQNDKSRDTNDRLKANRVLKRQFHLLQHALESRVSLQVLHYLNVYSSHLILARAAGT